jgi:choice-of-anchor B domain-containing protein
MKLLTCTFMIFACFSIGFAQNQNVKLIANVNDYPNIGYSDCWGYTAPNGNEYALLGVNNGVSIVDVTDQNNIAEVVFIPHVNAPPYGWYDMKTYQNYMYVSSEGWNTVLIVDLSGLPDSASKVGLFSGLTSEPHNIFIDTEMGILYVVEDFHFNPAVRIFSLSDPLKPVELSSIGTANIGIDAHDIFAQDSVLYVAEGDNPSIGIFDVSDPANPSLLTRLNIPSAGYVHQVWVTEDNKYMITTEETPGKTIKIWDIQNLDNISLISEYLGGSKLAHNAYFKEDFVYIAHYESGLKVLDFSDPTNVVEVGFYDTYPQAESPNFNGAWGVYPFTSNGKIFISDIQTGLYVLQLEQEQGPQIAVTPIPVDFGKVEVGTTSDVLTVTIRNFGTEDLTISAISDPGAPFSLSGALPLPMVIPPTGFETFELTFSPVNPGITTGTITISCNDADNSSYDLQLSGNGVVLNPAIPGVGYATIGWGTNEGAFLSIDLETGKGTQLGSLGIHSDAGRTGSWAIAINSRGEIIAADIGLHSNLYRVDAATGNTILIGKTDLEAIPALAYNADDVLYAVDYGGYLYILNDSTAASTLIGKTAIQSISGLAFDPTDGTLWASRRNNNGIYKIDLSTGRATLLGNTGLNAGTLDLCFDGMGNLYGTTGGDQNLNNLISIQKSPAIRGKVIGSIGFQSVHGMAIYGDIESTRIDNSVFEIPTEFSLEQNYPNPFNPNTSIKYVLKEDAKVSMKVYNMRGQLVKTLVNEQQTAGVKNVVWNGSDENGIQVTNGVYIYKIQANDFAQSKKMIFLK